MGSDRMTINTDTSILPELAACSSISIPENLLNVSEEDGSTIVDNIEGLAFLYLVCLGAQLPNDSF